MHVVLQYARLEVCARSTDYCHLAQYSIARAMTLFCLLAEYLTVTRTEDGTLKLTSVNVICNVMYFAGVGFFFFFRWYEFNRV
jgi:hypothetical protein